MIAAAVTGGIVSLGALAWGAFERNSPLFGPVQRKLPGSDRAVALTFDDGPNPDATPLILDTLGAEGVPGTFFVLGRHAERWPAIVARTAHEGHAIGNHGFHHRKLIWRTPSYVRDDIERGTAAIERASGVRPGMFRAPHGQRSPWVTPIARAHGQRTVGWSLGVWDTALPGEAVIADRVMRGARAGSIVLLHDGDGYDPSGNRMQTARSLKTVIRGLRDRGFSFVALTAA
jgi:peptidoglycan/xylan/chitin deacetylase (PgdA/CDA1 family)